MQVLSCSSACALVAICGLLLRSQSLVSAARSPNFEYADPSTESIDVSTELVPVIVLLIILLAAPSVLAIILAIFAHSKFKTNAAQFQDHSNTIQRQDAEAVLQTTATQLDDVLKLPEVIETSEHIPASSYTDSAQVIRNLLIECDALEGSFDQPDPANVYSELRAQLQLLALRLESMKLQSQPLGAHQRNSSDRLSGSSAVPSPRSRGHAGPGHDAFEDNIEQTLGMCNMQQFIQPEELAADACINVFRELGDIIETNSSTPYISNPTLQFQSKLPLPDALSSTIELEDIPYMTPTLFSPLAPRQLHNHDHCYPLAAALPPPTEPYRVPSPLSQNSSSAQHPARHFIRRFMQQSGGGIDRVKPATHGGGDHEQI